MVTAVLVDRIDSFHTHVETEDKEIEIESEAESVADCQLLPEIVQTELSLGLFLMVAQVPDVSCIHKQCATEFPEQVGTVFQIEVKFHLASMHQEVVSCVFIVVSAGAQASHTPSAQAVGTSREVGFLERQLGAVAIGVSQSHPNVEDKLVAIVKAENAREVEIASDVLCECHIEECPLTLIVSLEVEGIAQ